MHVNSLARSAAVLAVLASLLAAPPATAAPSGAWETEAIVAAYQRGYPGLTESQARRAYSGQERRIRLLEQLQTQQLDSFGGSWYDPYTDTQHINTVTQPAAEEALALSAGLGLKTTTHPVTISLKELRAQATKAGATVDVINNRLNYQTQTDSAPEACTDKYNCGRPLRSGVVLWARNYGEICSLGFTARGGDRSKWAITAGHCAEATGEGVTYGHGEQPIGPIKYSRNSGEVDVARIHVQGTYWSTGGYFFNLEDANTPIEVDHAIDNRGTIQIGDAVCLSSWHSTLTESCGTITTAFGVRGMPTVNFDACSGDSGGGWYFPTTDGTRWAYGIHRGQSSSGITCHQHTLNDSVFTALPDINAWWDTTTASTLRVEER
ncbi:hypothetical protein Rhe02_94050 [Rhizocola hellebori]|uniref:Serine protease n=1 Tax=Rhizocola hellebori TaxID=1392758 RepID=A0A8J3VMP4_9ACTN|nr:hypothetical protein [Rhizocola hellebori]GIH11338.1 hypothetical protein Rhe02_94050 [Rhizocola hellebori]